LYEDLGICIVGDENGIVEGEICIVGDETRCSSSTRIVA
jgi:uncharacterized Fe-S cluster-containing protein